MLISEGRVILKSHFVGRGLIKFENPWSRLIPSLCSDKLTVNIKYFSNADNILLHYQTAYFTLLAIFPQKNDILYYSKTFFKIDFFLYTID